MAHQLTRDVGYVVGRKRAGTLMETMGIEAIYPKPNLSQNKTLIRYIPIFYITL